MTGDQNSLLLTEVLRNAQAGLDAAQRVLEQAATPGLRRDLQKQTRQFEKIASQAAGALGGETSENAPSPAWEPLRAETLNGLTESRMAELLINGSSMGIIALTQKLGDCGEATPASKGLCRELINSEEIQIDRMKGYL